MLVFFSIETIRCPSTMIAASEMVFPVPSMRVLQMIAVFWERHCVKMPFARKKQRIIPRTKDFSIVDQIGISQFMIILFEVLCVFESLWQIFVFRNESVVYIEVLNFAAKAQRH